MNGSLTFTLRSYPAGWMKDWISRSLGSLRNGHFVLSPIKWNDQIETCSTKLIKVQWCKKFPERECVYPMEWWLQIWRTSWAWKFISYCWWWWLGCSDMNVPFGWHDIFQNLQVNVSYFWPFPFNVHGCFLFRKTGRGGTWEHPPSRVVEYPPQTVWFGEFHGKSF